MGTTALQEKPQTERAGEKPSFGQAGNALECEGGGIGVEADCEDLRENGEDELADGRTEQRECACHNRELGRRGEEAAARYLERRGFEILERNWTCPAGEADIIAQDENTLVFVEVKTRSNTDKGLPEEAVDQKKRERYERIAAAFLGTYDAVDVAVRFDVVSILAVGGERALLRYHHNAFSADE